MYRQRQCNFLTVIGSVILGIFAINSLFMDAVSTAQNLAHLADWSKQSGLDAQINLAIKYVLFMLDAYAPILVFIGLIAFVLCKK